MKRPPPGVHQSLPAFGGYVQGVIRGGGVIQAFESTFVSRDSLEVFFVSGGVFAEEDLAAALSDAAGVGGVVGIELGEEVGWVESVDLFLGVVSLGG